MAMTALVGMAARTSSTLKGHHRGSRVVQRAHETGGGAGAAEREEKESGGTQHSRRWTEAEVENK